VLISNHSIHVRFVSLLRQSVVILVLSLLSGCSLFDLEDSENVEVREFIGGVAGDEPQAVLAARGILRSGGNAVDAATALYFALSVTLPSSASLGSGGVCLVHDAPKRKTEALDFVLRTPRIIPQNTDRPSAIPGSPMGMFVLHTKYGNLPWSQLVAVGERLARFGSRATRTLVNDLEPVAAALFEDASSRKIFADRNGNIVAEGSKLVQLDLANVLANIRVNGPVDLYSGKLAARLVEAVKAAGGSLSLADLRDFSPRWLKPAKYKIANRSAFFFPPPGAAGIVLGQMIGMLDVDDEFDDSSEVARLHLLAETAMRALAERQRWMTDDYQSREDPDKLVEPGHLRKLLSNFSLDKHTSPGAFNPRPAARPENPSATSFVVVDRLGSAVACELTMNNRFGVGRIAPGTGVMLAAVSNNLGRGPVSMGPMMVVHEFTRQFHFAGAATGGVAAPTALANVAARVTLSEESLRSAMDQRRVHHGGAPDTTYYEPGIPPEVIAGLTRRGHRVAATPTLGIVNAASCPEGMPREPDGCEVVSDRRGSGLAINVNRR
jgi:gamma-glutamyltranspeptidase/glutathione hydrolase